jgi:hypothetical protein
MRQMAYDECHKNFWFTEGGAFDFDPSSSILFEVMLIFIPEPEESHSDCRTNHSSQNHQAGCGAKQHLPKDYEQDHANDKSRNVGKAGNTDPCLFHFALSMWLLLHNQLSAQHAHLTLEAILACFIRRKFNRCWLAFRQGGTFVEIGK